MRAGVFELRDETRRKTVAARIRRASGPWQRLVGLVGRPRLLEGEGLWLDPCNGVHTFGVRGTLDLVMMDRALRVVAVCANVPPGRVRLPVAGAHSTVELRGGTLAGCPVEVGDQMALAPSGAQR